MKDLREVLKGLEVKEIAKELKKAIKSELGFIKGISVTTQDSWWTSKIWVSYDLELTEEQTTIVRDLAGQCERFVKNVVVNGSWVTFEDDTVFGAEEKEAEYQKALKEQEEYRKECEIKRAEREKLYNNTVTVEGVKNAIVREVKDKDIFVIALEPALNKNNWKIDNDEEINEKSYSNKYKITHIIELSNEEYNYFSFNLLNDYDFLQGTGGSEVEELENGQVKLLYGYAVAIVSEGKETIIVDAQGYSYARYTCRLVEDIENKLNNETNNVKVNNSLFNEVVAEIENNTLYVVNVRNEAIVNDCRYIRNKYFGKTYVTGFALKELLKEGKASLEIDPQPRLNNKENFDYWKNYINAFKNGSVMELGTTTVKDSPIYNIDMVERLESELKRIPTDTEPTPPEDKQPLPKESMKQNKEVINNVITVDFTSNKTVKAELKGDATKRQLWAIHCITKINTTGLNISKKTASELIGKSKQGISIIDEVKALLSQNITNVK